jgi:DNA-binding transcriptional ArsR family regulator
LKALADPTRLRILHFLAEKTFSASELARLLRLRLPTVIHHLRLLRLAGLVQITVGETEKRYAARLEILDGIQQNLTNFIRNEE